MEILTLESRGTNKMKRRKGILIAIEGIDGSGKTTQSKLLYEALVKMGFPTVLSHEPTEGPFGEEIRKKLSTSGLSPEEAYDLFVRDRKEHVNKKIIPSLEAGKIVIVDRYFISTIAYQGAGGISLNKIIADHEKFAPIPDLVIILDIPVDEAIKRLTNKNRDSFERNRSFLQEVRRIYLNIGKLLKTKVIIIDARKNVNEIHKEILFHVLELIKERFTGG